ncbi:hypothetical protein LUZ60_000140 [Juncus effusus]|nr:hypothetical protein LUZ60_000140 [Juncus effusus]
MAEAEATFGGKAVATSTISNLVNRVFSKLDELNFPKSSKEMETSKKKLEERMDQIQAVLTAVDRGQVKVQNEALSKWVWQFRDAFEEAEDALDEIDYYKLEEKVKARDNDPSIDGTVPTKKKILNLFKHIPSTREDTLKRLKKAVKGLDTVFTSMKPFLEIADALGNNNESKNQAKRAKLREMGSFLTESVVFGRDKEKEIIYQWMENLGDENEGRDSNVSALSIVGMGGMGKTTLARVIYGEVEEKKIMGIKTVVWVSVCDNFGVFDATVVLRKILQDITKSGCDIKNLNTLQTMLKEKVVSMKFLLVLDDVWKDDENAQAQWEEIMAPLKYGRKGSKILFTTRAESIAKMVTKIMNGSKEKDCLRLGGLDEINTLKLLNKHAFAYVDQGEHMNLQIIAEKIAAKLGGCPLAAKVMGGLLNNHIDFEHWERIWKQDISNIPTGEIGIMAVLRLSYHHLPGYIQACFRFCSIFPYHHKFSKDDLVKMWMGSGLIRWSKNSDRPEDIGGEYFDFLIWKSIFDASRDSEHYYVMHDLMHEMVISISSGECLRIDGDISKESIPRTVRNLSIKIENLVGIKEISHLKHVRSLLVTFEGEQPGPKDILEFNNGLEELRSLRLFCLMGANLFELPDCIGDLIHLRYLSISQMAKRSLSWLPKSAYKLYHLELIKVFAYAVKEISKEDLNGLGNFINLQHLDVHYSVTYKLPWIGKLVSLKKLEDFNLWDEEGFKINELKGLNYLQELNINKLENVKNPEEAKEAKMNEKRNLVSLSLYWANDCSNSELIIDNLRPHPNLEKLDIIGYYGIRSPNWLENGSLSNLVSLKLYSCRKLESLPQLGKLSSLEILWINNFPEVKEIDRSFYGGNLDFAFQSLKELRILSMPQWSEWVELQDCNIFPQLERLELENIPMLRVLPTLPLSLKHLSFRFCGLEIIPNIQETSIMNRKSSSNSQPSLSIFHISYCPDLISLNAGLLLQQERFESLEDIRVEDCKNVTNLPLNGFSKLLSLKMLRLCDCPILRTQEIQENILPKSLIEIWVSKCGLEEPLLPSLLDLSFLVRLDLTNCTNIRTLPPKEVFITLQSLRDLRILNCVELSSLGGLGFLSDLNILRITGCPKLVNISTSQPPIDTGFNQGDTNHISRSTLKLGELYIDHYFLLLIEPLRSLSCTKKLCISWECKPKIIPEPWLLMNRATLEEINIDDASVMESVPQSITRLKSLLKLELSRANLIETLPELPISLSSLVITGCNQVFAARYKRDSGSNWAEIADIPHVVLI